MRVRVVFVLLSLAMMLAVPHLVMAANPIHYFDCKDCHRPGFAINQIDSNICLSCHDSGGATVLGTPHGDISTGAGAFATGDASDQYGNNPVPGDQTSHNWAAVSTNPAAGASEPNRATYPGFYSRYGTTVGTVACSRCHDPHAQFGTGNDKLLPLNAARTGPMTTNDMCIACHTDFDGAMQGNHGLLSHPMVDNYEAFAGGDANYKTGIAVYDPANPYASGVQLVDGNITCVTCHTLHFGDSDVSTADGPGQALNAGDGLMLRGDGTQILGASGQPTGGSICIECHDYANSLHGANGGTKDVGCLACHGGHNYNGGAPTWYMLNDPTGAYSGGAAPPVDLNAAWVGTEGVVDGFCESCHGDITEWNAATDAGVGRDHDFATDAGQCDTCHNSHGEGSFSDAAGCTDCHGWPPVSAVVAAIGTPRDSYAVADQAYGGLAATTYDYNSNNGGITYLDESTTAHGVHALGSANEYKFACGACHQGNTHNDANGGANNNPTFQDVFIDTTGLVATTGSLVPTYAGASNTCAAVYCHSDGVNVDRDIVGPNAVVVPTWASGTNTICTSCHNTGTSGTATVHATHLALPNLDGAAITCGTCHDDTWAAANTLKTETGGEVIGSHVDGDVDVTFNTTLVPAAPMNQVAGTCAVYCHSNGTAPVETPDWDVVTTGDCGDCHAIASGAGLTGAHDTHLDEGLACNDCHTHDGSVFGGDHINGTKDITTDVCNSCHGTVNPGSGVDAYPVFTDVNSVTCNTCHQGVLSVIGGNTAPDTGGTITNSHSDTCTTCHTSTTDALHVDGISSNTLRLIAADSNTACNSCHGNAGSGSTIIGIDTHQAINCASCHDPHYGGSNLSLVRETSASFSGTVDFTATTGAGSYDESDAVNTDDICATCHTAGNQTIQHNNKTNAGIAHNEGLDCFTCHKPHTDDVAAFGVGAGTNCSDCHGYPPVGTAHAAHTTVADGDKDNAAEDFSDCAACHDAAVLTYDYSAGGPHMDGTTDFIAGLGYNDNGTRADTADDTVTTCALACHATTEGVKADWLTDTSLACDACHGGQSSDTLKIATQSHTPHITATFDCDSCHNAGVIPTDTTHIGATGADEGATLTARATPVQDNATVDVPTEWIPGADTCSNIACHDPSSAGNLATWGTPNAAACAFCHADASTDPATGSHTQHLAGTVPGAFKITPACADCHGTLPVTNTHLSGTVDVTAGITYSADRTDFTNTTYGTCSTTDCHNDGLGVAKVSPTWGRAPSAADDCTI
ncbi:MAG: CxxxxCH/CxxCH domain-containing protein, partial [Desulfuromonadales bacterium]|nr:CxxxxCH/CxxCH domain-containing protein [Desulfuromonadales bacterium]